MANGTREGVQPLAIFSRDQTDLGSVAVLVFFVISGYLITRSFDRSPQPLRFLKARALRIFPGLFLTLVLTAVLLGPTITTLPLGAYFRDPNTAQYVYGGLSLVWLQYDLPGVFQGNPTAGVVNGSLWTLYYEFLMYLMVLALGMARVLRRDLVLVLWAVAMALLWRWVGGYYVAFGVPFLSGAVLYLWRDRVPLDWRLAAIGAVILLVSLHTTAFRLAFATVGAYLVMFLAVAPSVRLPNLARRGDLSYGIYIFAYPVEQTVAYVFGPAVTWQWVAVLSLPASLVLASLSWHFVEAPALSLKGPSNKARIAQR